MLVSDIQLFQILKQRLGEKEAEALVEFVDHKLKETNEVNLKILATKEDILKLELKLETKISEKHNDLLKWMIVMWITQLVAIAAIIKYMT